MMMHIYKYKSQFKLAKSRQFFFWNNCFTASRQNITHLSESRLSQQFLFLHYQSILANWLKDAYVVSFFKEKLRKMLHFHKFSQNFTQKRLFKEFKNSLKSLNAKPMRHLLAILSYFSAKSLEISAKITKHLYKTTEVRLTFTKI